MPKIIENLEARLVAEAKRQISENGYAATTIRSVASGCGVGVGTVYNYFSSKDALTAAFMLEDWKRSIAAIQAVSTYGESCRSVLLCIYDQLQAFVQQYNKIFQDEAARTAFAGTLGKYHEVLRTQLAEPLRKFCPDNFTAEFIAEALLTWTTAGKDFSQIYPLLEKLF